MLGARRSDGEPTVITLIQHPLHRARSPHVRLTLGRGSRRRCASGDDFQSALRGWRDRASVVRPWHAGAARAPRPGRADDAPLQVQSTRVVGIADHAGVVFAGQASTGADREGAAVARHAVPTPLRVADAGHASPAFVAAWFAGLAAEVEGYPQAAPSVPVAAPIAGVWVAHATPALESESPVASATSPVAERETIRTVAALAA